MSTHKGISNHQPARPEQESETPRTDAACVSREYIAREMDHYTQKFVLADFARQLERELARANALYEQVILGQRQLQSALTARERDALDAKRLDFLDRMNAMLNKHYGTNYGWRLVLTHNVTRLMRDGRASASGYLTDIDLNDMEGGRAKHPSCRDAIDEAMRSTGGS